MRARGDARRRHVLTHMRVEEITQPQDPRLGGLADLLQRTFADPNTVLGLDRIREFLSERAQVANANRVFHALIAQCANSTSIVGVSIFSYLPRANCGFSEYLVVDQRLRGRGLGRTLFDRRKAILDADADRHGHPTCNGVFIEVDSPWRTPPDLLAADSFDPAERLRVFRHLGFLRVSVAYVQPPLAPDKAAVEHMDLLFASWSTNPRGHAIPANWIVATLEPIWSAWAPSAAGAYLARLQQRLVGVLDVALVDPLNPT